MEGKSIQALIWLNCDLQDEITTHLSSQSSFSCFQVNLRPKTHPWLPSPHLLLFPPSHTWGQRNYLPLFTLQQLLLRLQILLLFRFYSPSPNLPESHWMNFPASFCSSWTDLWACAVRDLSCMVHVPKLTVWNEMLYMKTEEGKRNHGNDCVRARMCM